MLYINAEMKKILSDDGNQNFTGKVQSFLKEILDKTKILGNCVIYDDEGIDEADINWNIVSKFARDWTEYEVACNEFRLRKDEFRDNQYQSLLTKYIVC